jgi:uncharacterized membrane protein YhaH (DUF805 family)
MLSLLRLWFGFSVRVTRGTYLATGLGLMLLKYFVDAGLAFLATSRLEAPWVFVNPVFAMRRAELSPAPGWLLPALVLAALPFAWIGASMSARRATDAERSPWLALLFFVPGLNWLMMLFLASAPSRGQHPHEQEISPVADDRLSSALLGIAAGAGIAVAMTAVSVYGLGEYGSSLFFLCPVLMGVTSAFLYNRHHPRRAGETVTVALASVAVSGGLLLLFAVEGLMCLAMAAPLACFFAWLGALLGRSFARFTRGTSGPLVASVFVLPLLAGTEYALRTPELHQVVTAVEIDASPDAVWPHVIAFSPLDPPPEWFFRAGIAYPMAATIDGTGVGAVRRCQFSTGAFVEPITVWEAPYRLGFDVSAMPPTMEEWSPYRDLRPPHLEGSLVTKRGEFRLVPLDGGRRTRLEGSTFYTLALEPEPYWRIYAEWLLHEIHGRVLRHIAARSEVSARVSETGLPPGRAGS